MTNEQIGKNIKAIRKLLNLNQEYIAKYLEILRASYSQIELGKRKLTALELYKLCKIFKTSPDLILQEKMNEEILKEIDEDYFYSLTPKK